MKHKKWNTLSAKTVHTNPFFKVHEYDVERSDGSKSKYYVADRYGPFSIIIPFFPDKTTLLVGQYRFANDYYSWEFPMGHVRGKTPLQMAKQELKEETGFSAKQWIRVGSFYISNGFTNQEGFVYTARDLTEGEAHPEEGELLQLKRVPIADVSHMIKDGEIKDGPTLAAYQLFSQSNMHPYSIY